jgi:Etoposide-induced protein 2.4 (EI24)
MKLLVDSFWRAAAYCVHPRVILLSLMPLAVSVALAWGLAWFYWEPAVAGVRALLESWDLLGGLLQWIDSAAGPGFRMVLAPLVVVALAVPVIVLLSLVLVALIMTPALVSLVAQRRFSTLERKHGAGLFTSAVVSLGATLVALVATVASMPLWLIPPLVLLLPPLIWGWLTTQVMSFDVLAEHASSSERKAIRREHRWPLLAMGVITGYLGAAPSMIWAIGAITVMFAPVLIAISIWLYTLIFAFAALWFAHYGLAALALKRQEAVVEVVPAVEPAPARAALVEPMPPDMPRLP